MKRTRCGEEDTLQPGLKRLKRYSFSEQKLNLFFARFQTSDGLIETSGILALCDELQIAPLSTSLLVVAFLLEAKTKGSFTKEEFLTGMSKLSLDSVAKLKNALPSLKNDVLSRRPHDLYKFAFHYLRDNGSQRLVALPHALSTISEMLGHLPHTRNFVEYMTNHQTTYKAINLDQWNMFLTFNKTVDIDFKGYDSNEAWPLVLDDFVSFMKLRKQEKRFDHHYPHFGYSSEPRNYESGDVEMADV
eukprot:TRINITY_DN1263_c1_g1_i1.p1 TRINITY_DN1263_c1_g1~~TRINITY_DN1263_c1_g1_i1.p1  ORF type:complete len:266 (+),score=29.45 TRINITY_DN1263_c1_g1_i1:63-800(+)